MLCDRKLFKAERDLRQIYGNISFLPGFHNIIKIVSMKMYFKSLFKQKSSILFSEPAVLLSSDNEQSACSGRNESSS